MKRFQKENAKSPSNLESILKIKLKKKNLLERRARTSIGGAILPETAFSRNFHVIGTLLAQQIWDTRRCASSGDGSEVPAELRIDESWTAHRRGSLFRSWADLVSSSTLSHRPGWVDWLSWHACTDTTVMPFKVKISDDFIEERQKPEVKENEKERDSKRKKKLPFFICCVFELRTL